MNRTRIAILIATVLPITSLLSLSYGQDEQAKIYPVLSGVGLALMDKDGHIYVMKVLPDSPAEQSKRIAEGDRLLSVTIDGVETSLEGKSYSEAASLIRGPVGTELVVSIMRLNKDVAFDVRLTREPLAIAGASNSSYKDFVGRPMPELTLKSLDEKESSQLKDYHGKVVVLDFWASWCPTCYSPVTKLQKIVTDNPQWREKVEFITVTVDSNLAKALAVIEKQEWNHTQNSAVDIVALNEIGVSVIPLVVIIAPDGTIAAVAGAHAIDVEKEVASIVMRPPSHSPGTATDLRGELLRRLDIDQEARMKLIQWEKEHGPLPSPKSPASGESRIRDFAK